MDSNSKLYISQTCEWDIVNMESSEYIRIFDWRQGREILLTTESCKIWKFIDNGYKVNEIIQIMEKEKITPAQTLDILHQLVCLKLIIILNGL